ncbi:MAG: hypothetical protein HC888_03010 [Candidatus Competibacteraceae bacterium]|nr:hypothetical protein [Candidatus Competibacteraceae bacterium]
MDHAYQGDLLFFRDAYPPGCPTHDAMPYAFKPFAFDYARQRGYEIILWVDCSFWATQNVMPCLWRTKEVGHLMVDSGWAVGQWCSDVALATLGTDRESIMTMPMYSAGFTGLDVTNPRSAEFLDLWLSLAKDGITFRGDWTNANKEVSDDDRVLGHRHDMTAASFLACKLGMSYEPNAHYFSYAGVDDSFDASKVYFLARGM